MGKIREVSEFVGYLSGEAPADVFAWLTSPRMGVIEPDWEPETED